MGAGAHPFVARPHRTFLTLSLPVLLSLIAEPLAALVDTAFVARLGAVSLAGLGVGTTLLSSVFWIFGFLGIAPQTEIARALGREESRDAAATAAQALRLACGLGVLLALVGWPLAGIASQALGADAAIAAESRRYLEIRLLGAPALLMMMAAFGSLRGVQDMRTPLRVALLATALNTVGDALLVLGAGPVPAFGIAGAAWATTLSQVVAAGVAVRAVQRRLGRVTRPGWKGARRLLAVGGELALRTAALTAFLVLATRVATELGAETGAAHHAVRQVWFLTALLLDAYAASAQSLVGYFLGAGRPELARRVARTACLFGLASGTLVGGLMLIATRLAILAWVPAAAVASFTPAWAVAAAAQPLAALSFVTDGVHWGAGDWRYLRNAMLASTTLGILLLLSLPEAGGSGVRDIWIATAAWIGARAIAGVVRIWPGAGRAPLYAASGD